MCFRSLYRAWRQIKNTQIDVIRVDRENEIQVLCILKGEKKKSLRQIWYDFRKQKLCYRLVKN